MKCGPHLHDSGLLDELGQIERGLLDTPLALQRKQVTIVKKMFQKKQAFKYTCRYFLLKHQCLGTGTVFRVDLRWTRRRGSRAVTSCISTTSGLEPKVRIKDRFLKVRISLIVPGDELLELCHGEPVELLHLSLRELRLVLVVVVLVARSRNTFLLIINVWL